MRWPPPWAAEVEECADLSQRVGQGPVNAGRIFSVSSLSVSAPAPHRYRARPGGAYTGSCHANAMASKRIATTDTMPAMNAEERLMPTSCSTR
jgi:hypothetical protein